LDYDIWKVVKLYMIKFSVLWFLHLAKSWRLHHMYNHVFGRPSPSFHPQAVTAPTSHLLQ
jgi:hypothetical protein